LERRQLRAQSEGKEHKGASGHRQFRTVNQSSAPVVPPGARLTRPAFSRFALQPAKGCRILMIRFADFAACSRCFAETFDIDRS
jgi:hypothetical protein